ncbi:MAG: hypothetical protein ACMUHY_08540 [Thermoplasmatota archaeon]
MGQIKEEAGREHDPRPLHRSGVEVSMNRPAARSVHYLIASLIFGFLSICLGLYELTSVLDARFQTDVIYGEHYYLYRISFFPAVLFTVLGIIFCIAYFKRSRKKLVMLGLMILNLAYYVLAYLVYVNYSGLDYAGV